jgi:hypothetical protein
LPRLGQGEQEGAGQKKRVDGLIYNKNYVKLTFPTPIPTQVPLAPKRMDKKFWAQKKTQGPKALGSPTLSKMINE